MHSTVVYVALSSCHPESPYREALANAQDRLDLSRAQAFAALAHRGGTPRATAPKGANMNGQLPATEAFRVLELLGNHCRKCGDGDARKQVGCN